MKMNTTTAMIEPLESRIAPAGVLTIGVDGKSVTWDDVDGDKVTLRVTKGTLVDGLFTTDQTPARGLLVTSVNLTDPQFKGTNVTVSVLRNPLVGGDGTTNIGYINATGQNLGLVSIKGDLGRIDAGILNPVATTPKAVLGINVASFGMVDGSLLPIGLTQTSELVGKVGPIVVKGSVKGILFNVTGDAFGSIDAITIGGSLIGTDEADSGRFATTGGIGTIFIKGNVLGGDGQNSGSIQAGGSIKAITINGSVFGGRSDTPSTEGTGVIRSEANINAFTLLGSIHGGTQQDSGLLTAAGNLGVVKISGGIIGGSAGTTSGGIIAGGNLGSLSIRGDVNGGNALESGIVRIAGKAGTVTLSGALIGGSAVGSGVLELGTNPTDSVTSLTIGRDVQGGSANRTGVVDVAGKIALLTMRGSLRGGSAADTGVLVLASGLTTGSIAGDIIGKTGEGSGRIVASGAIGSLTILGNLLGGTNDFSGSIVSSDNIGRLAIGGSVLGGDLADTATGDLEGSALIQASRIGALSIAGTLRAGADYSATADHINNASIRVANDIGTLGIRGGIEGTKETTVFITARGQALLPLDPIVDIAIGTITIGGDVRHGTILAGYNTTPDVSLAEANPNAQILTVTVDGDFVASNLVAGAKWNERFGDGTDVLSDGVNSPQLLSRITKIVIRGSVVGTADDPTDHYGIVAQAVTTLITGGLIPVSLNIGKSNDNDSVSIRYNLANTGDVRVFEFLA